MYTLCTSNDRHNCRGIRGKLPAHFWNSPIFIGNDPRQNINSWNAVIKMTCVLLLFNWVTNTKHTSHSVLFDTRKLISYSYSICMVPAAAPPHPWTLQILLFSITRLDDWREYSTNLQRTGQWLYSHGKRPTSLPCHQGKEKITALYYFPVYTLWKLFSIFQEVAL